MGKTKDLFMKIGDTKGKIHTKIKHNKGQIQKGPNRGRRLKKSCQENTKLYRKLLMIQLTTMILSLT